VECHRLAVPSGYCDCSALELSDSSASCCDGVADVQRRTVSGRYRDRCRLATVDGGRQSRQRNPGRDVQPGCTSADGAAGLVAAGRMAYSTGVDGDWPDSIGAVCSELAQPDPQVITHIKKATRWGGSSWHLLFWPW